MYASSAATYGDGSLGFEDDESRMAKLAPLNPYGRSKDGLLAPVFPEVWSKDDAASA